MDLLPKEFECQSISLSPLIPSSSGTWTRREEDQRCRDGVRRAYEMRGVRGVELKKEQNEECWHEIFLTRIDADLRTRKMCGEIVFTNYGTRVLVSLIFNHLIDVTLRWLTREFKLFDFGVFCNFYMRTI